MGKASGGKSEFRSECQRSRWFEQFELEWQSPSSRQVLRRLAAIGQHREPVLILGPTGCGKSKIAKCIHELRHYGHEGGDSAAPFEQLNMAAISPTLAHSELFGYARGAFTGASREGHEGLILAANKGTLFLDEIADADMGTQAALLNFIDNREIRAVGRTEMTKVDVDIIAATNKDPAVEIDARSFREDLYHRLAAITLEVPPLAERRDDIPGIARSLVKELGKRYRYDDSLKASSIQQDALDELKAFGENWTGNVRQLESILVSAFVAAGANPEICKEHLPPRASWYRRTRSTDRRASEWELEEWLGKKSRDDMMRTYVRALMAQAYGVKKYAAQTARVPESTMHAWVSKFMGPPKSPDPADAPAAGDLEWEEKPKKPKKSKKAKD